MDGWRPVLIPTLTYQDPKAATVVQVQRASEPKITGWM
jgi:hypothetical protein